MPPDVPVREGTTPFGEYRTWHRVIGDPARPPGGKVPVLLLHGGPGGTHDSFEPLERVAQTGRPVVLYDQLSSGRSDGPDDPSLWTVALFVSQIRAVQRGLSLERVHLLGHSWGGMLALEYALTQPDGLLSLTLVGSAPATDLIREARERSFERLPPDVRQTLREHEEAQTFEDPEYEEALEVFYRRYVLRLGHRPGWWDRTLDRFNTRLNVHMWEPDGGELSDWDVRPRLREIRVPTLIMAGRHDGTSAGSERVLHEGIAGSELVVFEESSHYPFAEEPTRFFTILDDFLARAETNGMKEG